MLALILLFIFSLSVAYFATQNTGNVHILIGNYLFRDIPLYVIVVGSLLIGIFVSWLISLVDSFSSFFILHGKDHEIKRMQKIINTLQEKNHDLEVENTHLQLKGSLENSSEEVEERPSFSRGIREAIG